MSDANLEPIPVQVVNSRFDWACYACGVQYRRRMQYCLACNRSGLIVPRFFRPADAQAPALPGMTARELAASDHATFRCLAFPGLRLATGAFVLAHGAPGEGKSTAGLQFADSIKPSVYLALEEGLGPNLAAKLRRLEIHSENLRLEVPRSTAEVFELARTPCLKSLVIDSVSVSTLTPEDCLAISRAFKLVLWANLQETKAGLPAGSNKWPHAADVVIKIESMRWRVTKSRYQQTPVEGGILCDTATA